MRIQRIIGISISTIIVFLLGFFNDLISRYFLNKDALIGLLFALIVVLVLYCQYLNTKNLKQKVSSAYDYGQLEEYRTKERNRKTYHEKLNEVKAELIEEMHKIKKEVKK